MISPEALLFALFGGILPALLWLIFWLREDRLHPEPRRFILYVFLTGMLAVPIVLPLEEITQRYVAGNLMFVIWAFIEEGMKLGAAYVVVLRRREVDEPIDAVMYMITAALGFAALENTLFLAGAIKTGGFVNGLDLGVLRFVGASLLHVVASGALGFFLAIGFYKRGFMKKIDALLGLLAAICLHTLFNLFILKSEGSSMYTFTVFAFVWLAVILLLVGFEKVKQIREG